MDVMPHLRVLISEVAATTTQRPRLFANHDTLGLPHCAGPKKRGPTDTKPKDTFAVIQSRVTAKKQFFKKVPLGVCEFVSFSDHLRSFGSPHHKQSSLEGSSSTSYLQNPVGLFSHSSGQDGFGCFLLSAKTRAVVPFSVTRRFPPSLSTSSKPALMRDAAVLARLPLAMAQAGVVQVPSTRVRNQTC
jgi:hypothetical protein